MPWYLGNSRGFEHSWFFLLIIFLALWSVCWTGYALWTAARRKETGWFVFFLLVHTAGIIEFMYLMFVAKVFSPVSKKSPRRRS